MKSKHTRLLSILLALLMACSVFALTGCPEANDPNQGNPGNNGNTPGTGDLEDPDGEERIPLDYLTADDAWQGLEIKFLEWSCGNQVDVGREWIPWEEIDVDGEDGDLIGDAIYDRNGVIEETYGVTITKEYKSIDYGFGDTLRNSIYDGTEDYQAITCRTVDMTGFVLEGLLTDLNSLDNLHTDMPWWSADSVKSYAFGDALYCAAPEMLLRDKGATALMFYNHTVATDNNITGLYEMADEGEWTYEEFLELANDVIKDLDGDDEVSSAADMYGMEGGNRDIPYYLFTGAGLKFAEMNEEGYLELTFGTDDIYVALWQDILDQVMYSDFYFRYNASKQVREDKNFDVFEADKALFQFGLLKSVLERRDMQSYYGVLPIPKYDEYQDDYASLVWMHHDSTLAIPNNVSNLDAVSAVIEHMSWISWYDVYPDFYDTIILGRSARDEQSKQMLKVVFSTRVFDPGTYWLEKSMHSDQSFLTLFENNTQNISSMWGGMKGKVEDAVIEFNEKIDTMG